MPVHVQDQDYCVKNGWKQQVRCLERKDGANQSFMEAETTSYYSFQPCPLVKGDFLSFVRFELLMMLCFALTFYWVQRRGRWHQQVLQYRTAGY